MYHFNLKCNENWRKAVYHASLDSAQHFVSYALCVCDVPQTSEFCTILPGKLITGDIKIFVQIKIFSRPTDSVPSKVFELGPIVPTLTKTGGVLAPKSSSVAENWLNRQEKASFLLILSESVEPIFQSIGPILRHTALEGTLPTDRTFWAVCNPN